VRSDALHEFEPGDESPADVCLNSFFCFGTALDADHARRHRSVWRFARATRQKSA
jgi:hypothetical protein